MYDICSNKRSDAAYNNRCLHSFFISFSVRVSSSVAEVRQFASQQTDGERGEYESCDGS